MLELQWFTECALVYSFLLSRDRLGKLHLIFAQFKYSHRNPVIKSEQEIFDPRGKLNYGFTSTQSAYSSSVHAYVSA